MAAAHARVVSNGGAPGIDGMTVEALGEHCREHWPRIRQELLGGTYQPQPVRRVEIPKPDGGVRTLGIPTVLDRMIQQALHQVLIPIFEPTFSDASFGFRPGRGTHDAVVRAREHIAAGYRWVVDLDLARFFDTVNHDVLMRLVAQRVKDKRVLRLIGRYLRAGMLEGGVTSTRTEGTPQGGPLSPLLSNILLDELDKELERRGHHFVRYADDCNVYVRSKAAGERVMASLEGFLTQRLRLKVNREKSAVARPWERTFLGYSFTVDRDAKLKVARRSVQRLKDKLRATLRAARGRRLSDTIEDARPHHSGMDGVLPAESSHERVRRTGPVAAPEAARCVVATVEAQPHPVRRTPSPWTDRGTRPARRRQWPGAVVERRSQSHERGRSGLGAAPAWSRELRRRTPAPCALNLNRRMPNGTYGGVGGGANHPAYPICTPSMGTDSEVKVLRELGHRNPREPQGRNHEGASEGSGERTDGLTNRNRIQGGAEQSERANDREAVVTKGRRRRSGGRVGKASALIWGDLASHLKG